jgi:hypothetical protein
LEVNYFLGEFPKIILKKEHYATNYVVSLVVDGNYISNVDLPNVNTKLLMEPLIYYKRLDREYIITKYINNNAMF